MPSALFDMGGDEGALHAFPKALSYRRWDRLRPTLLGNRRSGAGSAVARLRLLLEHLQPADPCKMITDRSLTRDKAVRTVQFYLLWGILFINVTAGIGILAQASPMMQDMFLKTPVAAATMVSLISLFNAGGRFFWASLSDYVGRRNTYLIFFLVQGGLFLLIPALATRGDWIAFQAALFAIFSMYGGGFSTIPAFLADMFGPENVGAIHGALLTAWSAAAIAGPVIITELSARARARAAAGASKIHIYDRPLQILACLLAGGFLLAILVRPLRHSAYEAPVAAREGVKVG